MLGTSESYRGFLLRVVVHCIYAYIYIYIYSVPNSPVENGTPLGHVVRIVLTGRMHCFFSFQVRPRKVFRTLSPVNVTIPRFLTSRLVLDF